LSKQSYRINDSLVANNSQRLLIGVPLVVTLVFSFCFVAMNPNKPSTSISASTKDTSSDDKPAELPEIPSGVVPEQTLSTEGEAAAGASDGSTSSTSGTSSSNSSATPAPAASPAPVAAASSPSSSNPQASSNTARQTITSKVNVTVTNTTKKLLGR